MLSIIKKENNIIQRGRICYDINCFSSFFTVHLLVGNKAHQMTGSSFMFFFFFFFVKWQDAGNPESFNVIFHPCYDVHNFRVFLDSLN